MSSSPQRPRTVQKKIRTYTEAFVENNTSFERRRGSTQKQFMRHFHLDQPKKAENAKYQLHEISEGNIQGVELYHEINRGDIGWTESQTHKWLTEEYQSHNQMKKNKTQSSQRQLSKNDYISCLDLSEIRKDRTKTSISYKSKQNPQRKNKKDHDISEQVTKIIRQSKQKYNLKTNKKCSFNQVINISPLDLGKNQEFINCKVKSQQEKKISMTEIKIPSKIQIHNKMKGPFFPKNKFQRKIVLHKGNTMMLYKQTEEINKKMFVSSHKESTPRQNLNNTNLQSLFRNSILDLDENRKIKESEKQKFSDHYSKTSPIQEQLQKIKKLITGEQLSYLEISSNCPIKIHRLKGNSNIQQSN